MSQIDNNYLRLDGSNLMKDLDMHGFSTSNLNSGNNNLDAVNRQYVDQNKVSKNGDFNKRYEWTSANNENFYAWITRQVWYTWTSTISCVGPYF